MCTKETTLEFDVRHQSCTSLVNAYASPPADKSWGSKRYYDRAKLLRENERPRSAMRDLEIAVRLNPTSARNYRERARVRLLKSQPTPGDFRASLEDGYRAVELGETSAFLYKDLAVWHNKLGQMTEALETASIAIARGAPHPMEDARRVKLTALAAFKAYQSVEVEATALIDATASDLYRGFGQLYRAVARCSLGDVDGFVSDLSFFAANPSFDLQDYLTIWREDGFYNGPNGVTVTPGVERALRKMADSNCGYVPPKAVPG